MYTIVHNIKRMIGGPMDATKRGLLSQIGPARLASATGLSRTYIMKLKDGERTAAKARAEDLSRVANVIAKDKGLPPIFEPYDFNPKLDPITSVIDDGLMVQVSSLSLEETQVMPAKHLLSRHSNEPWLRSVIVSLVEGSTDSVIYKSDRIELYYGDI